LVTREECSQCLASGTRLVTREEHYQCLASDWSREYEYGFSEFQSEHVVCVFVYIRK
jgi:hypothetical protein